jgi:hypothetical protein
MRMLLPIPRHQAWCMEHVTFGRFPDRQSAVAGLRALRERTGGSARVVVHVGARDAAEFEQVVQHSGEFAESDLRHALVVGFACGALSGAVLGGILGLVGLFPDLLLGAGFGALMGVLVGLVMMSIFGTGLMDRRLLRLTRDLHTGEIVVTVRTHDRAACAAAHEALVGSGATVAEKSQA